MGILAVGRWRARVGRPGGDTESEFEFARDGTAMLVVGGKGAGTWTQTGPDTFSYRIREELTGAQGAIEMGTIEIAQNAVLRGDEFVSEGNAVVRLANGTTAREAAIRITARRLG
ncbi:hypothetical protein SAMN05216188_104195 [Lentzea xinjiangensis]|uniref:Uncharacterized protein n=1 Tax=Lentzea xinjiangensis TaxID=402600 RepID=A0A1H9HTP0_9PSEU|nr:hypothetical protein [Lentzea xinjiangensis]SEQ65647.1 hypothetical protein SAMN05216188_104195 [Lentzea xinjiangensis]